jgi:serine/threonine-protein kinase RsbT
MAAAAAKARVVHQRTIRRRRFSAEFVLRARPQLSWPSHGNNDPTPWAGFARPAKTAEFLDRRLRSNRPWELVTMASHLATDEIRVRINSDLDIVTARQKGRALADELGFGPTDLAIIATAISELARNIVLHTPGGEITLKSTDKSDPSGMLVEAVDAGPGIPNIAAATQSADSSSGGLGLGLAGVRRLMDEFEIVSEIGRGTKVTAKKWK